MQDEWQYTSAATFPWKLLSVKEHAIKDGKRIVPIHVQINPTNKCNASCPWCFCKDSDRGIEMDIGEIKEIVSYFKELGTKAATISGGGEPTLHRMFADILTIVFENNIRIGLTTNGLSLFNADEPLIENINNTVDWIRISTMENHRNNGQNDLIDRLVSKLSVNTGISFTVSSDSSLDLAMATCRVANRYDHVSHVRFVDNVYCPSDEMMERVRSACTKITDKGIYQFRSRYKHGRKTCYVSKLRPLIDSDGRLYPCCGIHYAMKDNVKAKMPVELSMGRWNEFNLCAPFDGSGCDRCYYDDYNMVVERMLTPMDNPFHV